MDSVEIGKRMRQRRTDMEISVMDLVTATGLTKATIHRYENGSIKHIKLPVLQAIAYRLGVSVEWLMGETDNPERDQQVSEMYKDVHVILSYVVKLVHEGHFTSKGEPVDKNIKTIIQLTTEYLIAILDTEMGK